MASKAAKAIMRISAPGSKQSLGFTLVEILVVIVILGVLSTLVAVNFAEDDREKLAQETTRLALLMEYARDEAIVRGTELSWQLDGAAYAFSYRDDNDKWISLDDDDMFKARKFASPIQASVLKIDHAAVDNDAPILFSPSGLNRPFEVQLVLKAAQATLTRDVLGRVQTTLISTQ